MKPKKQECPCGSGAPYASCCGPLHRGDREAPTAEALMRSRYAAFAMHDAEYLWRTLHVDHDDRQGDEAEFLRRVRAGTLKYMGLEILDRREAGDDGIAQVLFLARIFEKGKDRSFVELSDFAHDGEGWRYLTGHTIDLARIPGDPLALRIEEFRTQPSLTPG